MPIVQTVRRRRLGAELRRLRDLTGLKAEEVAEQVEGWSATKISRAENAQVAVKERDVTNLLRFYNADDDLAATLLDMVKNGSKRGWWQSYRDSIDQVTTDLIMLEGDATTFKEYEAAFIPGMLQTADYAREIISALAVGSDVNIDARVEVRMARQSVLTRKENPLELWAVIHEAAIRSNVGGNQVMSAQLDRLLERAKLSTVHIQVMPIDAAPHPGMPGAFTVLGFPQRRTLDVVHIETLLDGLWVEEPSDVELYAARFTQITAEAMSVERSLALIAEQRDRLNS